MQQSRYKIIWDTLKAEPDKELQIAVISSAHPRLKKAIIKRKDNDIAYKVQMDVINKKAKLVFKSKGNILSVTLTHRTNPLWL